MKFSMVTYKFSNKTKHLVQIHLPVENYQNFQNYHNYLKYLDKQSLANIADLDLTAPQGAVRSGSAIFPN